MRIVIESIPHDQQRYPTIGDWEIAGDEIYIRVSEELGHDSKLLVGMHELVEALLCQREGITAKEVDDFDMNWSKISWSPAHEPGDDPDAPYYYQHQQAMIFERLLATYLGTPWFRHEENCDRL